MQVYHFTHFCHACKSDYVASGLRPGLLLSRLIFCVAPLGALRSLGAQFIEPPEPTVSTPLVENSVKSPQMTKIIHKMRCSSLRSGCTSIKHDRYVRPTVTIVRCHGHNYVFPSVTSGFINWEQIYVKCSYLVNRYLIKFRDSVSRSTGQRSRSQGHIMLRQPKPLYRYCCYYY